MRTVNLSNIQLHGTLITALYSILYNPWNRILLTEKLTISQLLKKFPAIYVTRRFITAFASARHLSVSLTRSIQSVFPSNFLRIHQNIFLLSTPVSSKWYLSLRFSHQNPVYASPLHHTRYMSRPSHSSLDFITRKYWVRSTGYSALHYVVFSTPLLPVPT
jgi:hypothetical protein